MRLRRLPLAASALAALLAAAGCSSGSDEAAEPRPSTTTTIVSEGVVAEPVIAPLTGLSDPSGTADGRPALSVKIDNAPKARPQAGLDVADLVFEEVVEGGVTRFIAVFQSEGPPSAGPVRSVRPMDPKIVSALGGLVAYSGGIPEYVALMRKAPVQDVNIDVATSAYHWEKGRPKPHDLFVSPEKLWAMAKDKYAAPPPAMFEYRPAPTSPGGDPAGEPFGDAPAASVKIPYSQLSKAGYTWDMASSTWKRTQDGVAHTAASGVQISPTNLVVQFVSTRKLTKVDQSGNPVNESIVVGDGDAWVFSGGRVTKGRWSKAGATSVTRYTDAAGNPVKLAPGRTWVHYAPLGSPVSVG